jgi:hypothetical protein
MYLRSVPLLSSANALSADAGASVVTAAGAAGARRGARGAPRGAGGRGVGGASARGRRAEGAAWGGGRGGRRGARPFGRLMLLLQAGPPTLQPAPAAVGACAAGCRLQAPRGAGGQIGRGQVAGGVRAAPAHAAAPLARMQGRGAPSRRAQACVRAGPAEAVNGGPGRATVCGRTAARRWNPPRCAAAARPPPACARPPQPRGRCVRGVCAPPCPCRARRASLRALRLARGRRTGKGGLKKVGRERNERER